MTARPILPPLSSCHCQSTCDLCTTLPPQTDNHRPFVSPCPMTASYCILPTTTYWNTLYGVWPHVVRWIISARWSIGLWADYCRYAANKFVWRADGPVGARIWRPFGRKCIRRCWGRGDFRFSSPNVAVKTCGVWFLKCRAYRISRIGVISLSRV